jgi:hypothetical protein
MLDFRQRSLIPQHNGRAQRPAVLINRNEAVSTANTDGRNLFRVDLFNGFSHSLARSLPPPFGIVLGLTGSGANHTIFGVPFPQTLTVERVDRGLATSSTQVNP